MPHIHTEPNQHDMTVSGYIIRQENEEWKCLVHFHKKMDVYMQIGGHIELDETPWQAIAHELEEESGYILEELKVLQPFATHPKGLHNIVHPIPFTMNTHDVGGEHYHSDLCYGFIAQNEPQRGAHDNESLDLRWLSLAEMKKGAQYGEVLGDVVQTYEFLIDDIDKYTQVSTVNFSLQKPTLPTATYKRGGIVRKQ